MSSVFSQIAKYEIPAHIVAEDEKHLAFLDINPLVMGHVLVIPKKEVDYIYDLEDDELGALHIFAKNVAKSLKLAIPCLRIGISVVGLEVPHAHIHLIPLNSLEDINFNRMKLSPSNKELEAISKKIIGFH
tara:strand:+ start:221 stop:613 length:393 start_codon:yes stop_codon:yes gene_type:complete